MNPLTPFVINILASLTAFSHVLSVGLIIALILLKINFRLPVLKKIKNLVDQNYIPLIILISGVATLGSLTFSEILNFQPCKLCWFQRIFMYPTFIISLVALFTNDTKIRKYIMSLSIFGFVIAVYHILVQLFPQALECTDEIAKCSFKEFATFGYITIPVMSASAFLLIILVSLINLKNLKKNSK